MLGSIKIRRARNGLTIRATGDMADKLFGALSGGTAQSISGKRMRVSFVDEGQDLLRWVVDEKGRIEECSPFCASTFVGGKVHCVPVPGQPMRFSFPGSAKVQTLKYGIESVEVLP